ncbi:hypothetical protein DPMN_169208 [Dreissena polymorpha]|uniref:Uncharacterized protein n=1 Tax=Dreissena polymorpha TaxID=45954 RepID=A0A9D4J032_DREPO|nr:hypothetical protein DPMN_169208 [Dreissena polymorpha]
MVFEKDFADEFPGFKQLITNPSTGALYIEGEIMKLPKLARTFELIADKGPHAFYNGTLADDIVADIQEAGGIITKDDLANYTSLVEDALHFHLHDNNTVYSPPLPSSGAVYLFILNILKDYNFTADSVSNVAKATTTWHRVTEAMKHAYSLRTNLGDSTVGSDAFRTYVTKLVQNMTHPSFGFTHKQQIDDSRTFGSDYYKPIFHSAWEDHGTAHLSVIGPNGDAVSITSTTNLRQVEHTILSFNAITRQYIFEHTLYNVVLCFKKLHLQTYFIVPYLYLTCMPFNYFLQSKYVTLFSKKQKCTQINVYKLSRNKLLYGVGIWTV